MTSLTDEAQSLVETGGWDDIGGGGELFLMRRFDDQEQAIRTPVGNKGAFKLSQINSQYPTTSTVEVFQTLEEALTEAESWRRKVKVTPTPEVLKKWGPYLTEKKKPADPA